MNIALCYESVVPARGGCETYVADLARRLIQDRHEVHVYSCEHDASALPSAIVFHTLQRHRGPRFLRPWRFAAACDRALSDARHDVVIGFIKTWHQDVLIPQGGLHVASTACNLRKYRHPVTRILARIGRWLDISFWSYLQLERKQYANDRQRLIIAPSAMVKGHLCSYYDVDETRIRVIHNAIDAGRFVETNRIRQREEVRSRLGIPADAMVGLFVGHNYRLKGLDPLLHAVAELPAELPFHLIVCGGSRVARYQTMARRLGIRRAVHLLGFQRDVRPSFFAADFLVHPTFYDPCSLVVLEALACGLPVITTRYNGAAELLHESRDGYVIDNPHDYRTLALRIQQLCDKAEHADRADAARQTAAAWTFEHHYRSLLAVLEEAARLRQAA